MCKNHMCDMKNQTKNKAGYGWSLVDRKPPFETFKGFINGMIGGALLWAVIILIYNIVPW